MVAALRLLEHLLRDFKIRPFTRLQCTHIVIASEPCFDRNVVGIKHPISKPSIRRKILQRVVNAGNSYRVHLSSAARLFARKFERTLARFNIGGIGVERQR